ncbi:MAG TPA: DUF2075 domain-containing protein [Methanoculleus sp.]|nr:DUF2075 domain-containing protein [Methanoculleus sp.]
MAHIFAAADKVQTSDELYLNKTLRSHLAEDLHLWVNLLLDEKITEAMVSAENIQKEGFDIYCTKDLNKAIKYGLCRNAILSRN